MAYQSFCVMRKPAVGAPIRQDVPVLKFGTTQPFDPDAVGHILPEFDPTKRFRDSFGLDVAPSRDASVEGWIAFRADGPERMDVLVDGLEVASSTEFEAGEPYRDWDTAKTSFTATVDLSAVRPGTHRLQARITSGGGAAHSLTIPLLIR